jgi:site-specific recombinase XerD
MKKFESFLAPQLNDYITYRQNLGYSLRPTRQHLLRFDRYVSDKKIEPGELTPSFFLEFRENLKMEPKSINGYLGAIRVFFKFMMRIDYCTENPLSDIPPVPTYPYAPFIFSPEQTDQFIEAVCNQICQTPSDYLKGFSEYLALVLIARCGLRIKESLRLQLHHYRCRERTIYIEKTKFNKDRLIPIPGSVAQEIDNYLSVRKTLADDQNPYLFIRNRQNGLSENRLRLIFHRAVSDIGLSQPRKIIGHTIFASPTPHSLRHSFAINTLKRIKERGGCPNHALPVLATYMGHLSYRHTSHYLKFIDAEQRQGLFNFVSSKKENT